MSGVFRVKYTEDGKVIGRYPFSHVACDELFGKKEETAARVEDIL